MAYLLWAGRGRIATTVIACRGVGGVKLVLIVGGSTLVYTGLAWMMAVWPGIELSKIPVGPGVEPLTALQSERRDAMAGTASAAASENPSANLGAKQPGGYDAVKGAALYTANCSACHQANGEGLPGAFPSLKNDAVVNKDDATKHIDVVLNGMHDARVSGVVYSSVMPPFAATLSDAEIADLIDYERSSWGNHGKPIIAAQVGTERAKAK
jgi:cytochrome c oxidase cbb3-type subunit 2